MKIEFAVNEHLKGLRLDHAVSLIWEDCSRSKAAALIKEGRILVEGRKRKPSCQIKQGQTITGDIPEDHHPNAPGAEPMVITILHEDDDILVVNKAAGMVVHPAPGNDSGTLVNALLYHDPTLATVGKTEHRAGIVHRLDKDTSGVMVIARKQEVFQFLQNEFKQRRVAKRYLALALGDFKETEGIISLAIGRHPKKRKLMSVNSPRGKSAETLWWIKERFPGVTLVEVELKTGRTHQIRVHFRALGYPLLGDSVYGFKPKTRGGKHAGLNLKVTRQMLHAWKLSFTHPSSGERIDFTAPLPDDFTQVLTQLRNS